MVVGAAAAALAGAGPGTALAQGTTPGGTPPADSGGRDGRAARRAVGEIATRSGAFRDSVADALGDPEFQYSRPISRAWADRLAGGLTLAVSQPTGDFRRFAGLGVGITANAAVTADRGGVFGLRVEGGSQNYGRSASGVQNFGTFVNQAYQQVTTNNIYWGSIGPQLSVPLGPVRPYAFGSVGVANFATTSRLVGLGLDGRASQSFDITNLASYSSTRGYGGGLRFRIPRGPNRAAVAVDLGARAHLIRSARYLVPGLVTPDVDPALRAIRGQANFVTYHLGVTAGGR
jgi:hypothetical protein